MKYLLVERNVAPYSKEFYPESEFEDGLFDAIENYLDDVYDSNEEDDDGYYKCKGFDIDEIEETLTEYANYFGCDVDDVSYEVIYKIKEDI